MTRISALGSGDDPKADRGRKSPSAEAPTPIDILTTAHFSSAMAEGEETVGKIMDTKVNVVNMDMNVKDCAKAMAKNKAGYAVVVRSGTAMGIVTERDFVQKVIADNLNPAKVLIRDIMSTPLITITPSETTVDAAKLMSEYKVRRLVVIDEQGNLAGVVAATDLARTLAEKKGFSDATLNAIARLESPIGGPYQ